MDLKSLVLAPVRVPVRVAQALDDLSTLAERARRDPDPVEEVRERIDTLIVELGAVIGVGREIVDGGAELTEVAKDVRVVAAALVARAESLDATGQRIHDGGEDLTATAKVLSSQTRELIDGGAELTQVSEQMEEHLRVFRGALPHFEGALETVVDTVEPLQGAAERVGRVTNRLSRSK
jgi:methyl-accepting chemotaxis protein